MRATIGFALLIVLTQGRLALGGEAVSSAWFDAKELHFRENPELQHLAGSGWNPFNRFKWFYEQRRVNGQDPSPGARWTVWEEKRRRENLAVARASWFSVGPANFAGRMLALAFDPLDSNILYAGAASGGLWRSLDGGLAWLPLTDEQATLAVGGVVVMPGDPSTILIGTGEATFNIDRVGGIGVLKSTDAGASWATTSLNYAVSSGHGFHFLRVNPATSTVLAGATDGLWRSTDAGTTWTQVRAGGNYYDAQWKPGDANRAYCCKGSDGSGNNVKVSTDDGLTWTRVGAGQPSSSSIGKTKIAVTPDAAATIYAMYSQPNGNLLGVYRSTDDGANWELRASTPNIPGGQGWYNLSLAADPDNVDRVIAGGVNLYRSTDGGSSFATVGAGLVHVDHHDVIYRPGTNDNLFVATDGGVWESTTDGATWQDRNSGLVTFQLYDICVNNHSADPNFLMGGSQDQGTDRWSGTRTWSQGLGGDGMVCNINPTNGNVVYAEFQMGSHRKNTSGGVGGWAPIMGGITGTGRWVTPVDEDQQVGNHLYTETSAGLFRTTSGGNLWENVAPGRRAVWISLSPIDGDVVWAVDSASPQEVHLTTDDGGSWVTAASYGFLTATATKILAHPTQLGAAFVAFSGYSASTAHIALTTDFGLSWTDVTGDLPAQPVNAIAVDKNVPSLWFLGTDVGVWATTNGGTSWAPYETGLPNAVVCDLEIQTATRKLFAGTHGRGVWEVDFSELTALDPEENPLETFTVATTSLNLMFDPPWPNPVRDQATFRFAAKHSGAITLDVYDVGGRRLDRVAELSTGDGIIRLSHFASDDLADGVYFAVLQAGSERATRKFVVAH